jgi:hypothetical protein
MRDVFFRHRQELKLAQHDGGDIASPQNQAWRDQLSVVLGRTLQYMIDHTERDGPHLDATAAAPLAVVGASYSSSTSVGSKDVIALQVIVFALQPSFLFTGGYLLPCSEGQGQGGVGHAA